MLWLGNERFGGTLRLTYNNSSTLQILIILYLTCLLLLDLGSLGLPLDTIFDDVPDLVNKELPTGNVERVCFLWRLSYLQIRILDISDHINFGVIEIRTIECLQVLRLLSLPSFTSNSHLEKISIFSFRLINRLQRTCIIQIFQINYCLLLFELGYGDICIRMALGPVGREQLGLLGGPQLEDFI